MAEVITLDPGMSDAEKTKLVNDRIAEIAQGQYPSCKITTEYMKNLRWKRRLKWRGISSALVESDRLEIAREVIRALRKYMQTLYHWKR